MRWGGDGTRQDRKHIDTHGSVDHWRFGRHQMVQDNGRGSSVLQDQRDLFPLPFPCIMAVLFWVSHLAVDAELEGGGAVHVLQPRPGPAHAIAAHSHIMKRSESVKSQGRQLSPSMCSTRPLKRSQIISTQSRRLWSGGSPMRVGVSDHEAAVQVEQQILVIPAAQHQKRRQGGWISTSAWQGNMYTF